MLCAITVAAVVLVHKESEVNAVDESFVGAARVPEHNFDELMLFQEDEEATPTSPKITPQAGAKQLKQAGEVILLQEEPEQPIGSPVTEDTLEPVHASLRTGSLEKYGTDGFASNAVSAAGSEASEALHNGLSESAAYKKAQYAATDKVVSDAAVNGEAPAFSRTIRAAAYAAEMKALKQLEAGETEESARKVAHAAAQELINDRRAVKMSVPVPSTLEEQLSYVDHLWEKMRTKLASLRGVVAGMQGKECVEAKATAAAKHQEMKIAVLQASDHIAKGHESREAMEATLLQVDVHSAHVQQLMSTPDMALLQQQVQSASTKVVQSKRASATHHQRARQQAHLAEGFLSLAARSHKVAEEASLRCQAKHVLAKFGFAEEQMKKFEKLKKQGKLLKKQKHKANEKTTKAEAAKDLAAGKAKQADAEAQDAKKGQNSADAEAQKAIGEAKVAKNDAAAEKRQLAEVTEQNKALAKAMEISISQEMAASANQAAYEVMMESSGEQVLEEAKAAAQKACVTSMKTIAKSLATGMSEVASSTGKDAQAAMRKAILIVLKVGRPLQAGIVDEAVEYAAKKKMPSVKPVAAPAEPVKPVAAPAEPIKPVASAAAQPKVAKPVALEPAPASPAAQAVDEGKVSTARAVSSAKKDADEATKKADAEARALAAHKMASKVAALEAETGKVEVSVQKKNSKELATKKATKAVEGAQAQEAAQQAKLQKKIAKKTAKEAAQKETAQSIVLAKEKNIVEVANLAKAAAETKRKQVAAAAAKKEQEEEEEKERAVALNQAAGKVLVSATQAVRKATTSPAVQHATEEMAAVVNAAAGKAAEIARAAVAKAGGSKKQQLAAAGAAAAAAAKAAAAFEASKLRKQASSLAKDLVTESTTKQSGEQAKQFAEKDEVKAAKSRMPTPFEKRLKKKIAAAEETPAASPAATEIRSMDLIQVESQRMRKTLGAAAAKALEQARQQVHSKPALRKAIRKALKPVLNKEISRSVSLAAATAGKAAKVSGMGAKATQLKVVKAAQKAAKKAKSAVQQLAKVVIRYAMKTSA